MVWIRYASIYVAIVLLAFIIVGSMSKKNEDEYFGRTNSQIMKGVAILAVILCHLMGTFGGGTTLFTPLGGIGVSIFLMLSAYGLNESYNRGGVSLLVAKTTSCSFYPILYSSMHFILAVP